MIVLFALLAIILFLVITKTRFFKKTKESNNKLMTQLGMAILVGTITINTLISDGGTALKYTVVGIGIMSFIAILIEMIISKKKQTTS